MSSEPPLAGCAVPASPAGAATAGGPECARGRGSAPTSSGITLFTSISGPATSMAMTGALKSATPPMPRRGMPSTSAVSTGTSRPRRVSVNSRCPEMASSACCNPTGRLRAKPNQRGRLSRRTSAVPRAATSSVPSPARLAVTSTASCSSCRRAPVMRGSAPRSASNGTESSKGTGCPPSGTCPRARTAPCAATGNSPAIPWERAASNASVPVTPGAAS